MKTPDVIIIGAGAAGCAAAWQAQKAGADVLVLASQSGATRLASGFCDIADAHQCLEHRQGDRSLDLASNIDRILKSNPCHPYRFLDQGRQVLPVINEFIAEFADHEPGLLVGDGKTNSGLLTCYGLPKYAAFYPRSWTGALIERVRTQRVLLLEIQGYPGIQGRFLRQAIADLLPEAAALKSEVLTLGALGLTQETVATRIASALDQGRLFDELTTQMEQVINRSGPVDSVLTPPVLGLDAHIPVIDSLSERLGVPVSELPDPQSRITGARLSNALHRLLRSQGIVVVIGTVTKLEIANSAVVSLDYETAYGGVEKVGLKNLVLATGKFISDACALDPKGVVRERLTGFPLTLRGKPVTLLDHDSYFHQDVTHKQDFFAAGLPTDDLQRVIAPDGIPVKNLYGAGELLGGYDLCEGDGGLGVAIATGINAVKALTKV